MRYGIGRIGDIIDKNCFPSAVFYQVLRE